MNSLVKARIDDDVKEKAAKALAAMGLTISDAIRLLMIRISEEKRLPFEVRVMNETTQKAIEELESGRGERYESLQSLMDDLNHEGA